MEIRKKREEIKKEKEKLGAGERSKEQNEGKEVKK